MKRQISGHTRVMGLLGNPVEHTLSPIIHNTLSEQLQLDRVYVPFRVESEGLANAVQGAYDLNVLGLNVTVPHKTQVMQSVVELDSVASGIGAVNTLVRTESGYKGYNTDMPGLLRAIQSEGIALRKQTVVILGAGGASKAVAYMCLQEQAEAVYMLNRTLEKAQEIAEQMNLLFSTSAMQAMTIEDWKKIPGDSWIVFQCTSVGLSPNDNQVIIDASEFYDRVAVGVDLIYNPAVTYFMKLVRNAGGTAYNGLKMLLYQGIIAYELWNQISVSEEQAELVYDRMYEAIHPAGDNIVLIGYMGSGKSTIGRRIEETYEYTFLDTDTYIEEKEGRSISQIFAEDGEEYFRQLETDILQELIAHTHHTLIATGGGMPLRRENARLLRELGQVFYLQASEEEIWNRIKDNQDRPLLACENPREKIHRMMEQRGPIYSAAAHMAIQTDGKTVEVIAKELMEAMVKTVHRE